jgi:hypothetical protein
LLLKWCSFAHGGKIIHFGWLSRLDRAQPGRTRKPALDFGALAATCSKSNETELDINRKELQTMKQKAIAAFLISAFLVGCSTPQGVRFDETKRQPTASVEFFREGNKPTKAYKEIGEVTHNDYNGEDKRAMKDLIAQAKQMGANAIIMLPTQGTGYVFVPFGRSGNKSVWKAVAVVYQ